ncbi:hypothetical protein M406DRAFT_72835 [Cryphonectria parasitica EP155]|uniref:3-beta hydroxysteroid dehydrogenase/isomerase domain-containing protein n=1 Tax=Cryphonectria parasitica (strain ATCC 38755 / EP155) TaxID=660469 RepID=A0A9P4XX10_CRYP1|nr:uncharacterized protein M406DRAFT_72835 [Cryphonectria parasitica EP155]KAF3762849.1 hypothetical protein M406DRAFT_72835 [Cryphonectria parasitica EP155]
MAQSTHIPRAFITGASGFLATQIILLLLERGYHVVAAVRSQAKADAWCSLYPQHLEQGQIHFVVVRDMQEDGAYDDAVQGADIIFHTASPFSFTFEDNERDMLIPARKGALSVLESAMKADTIRKFIYTSSFAAVTSPHLDPRPGYIYSENDWNPVQWDEAVASTDKHFVYLASKTFAEQAVWDFARTRTPHFSITRRVALLFFHLAFHKRIYSPALHLGCRVLDRLIDAHEMPRTPAYVCVDVKDCALCHVKAAETDVSRGQRYLTVGSPFSQPSAAQTIARLFPEQAHRLPSAGDQVNHYGYSSARAEKDLGIRWTSFETTIQETFQQLLDIKGPF